MPTPQRKATKTTPKPARKHAATGRNTQPDAIILQGYLTWIYLTGAEDGTYERFEVQRAVIRDDRELAIDCDCHASGEPPYVYTILLHRQDSLLFRGAWSVGKAADRETGTCSCRLYSNGLRFALVGGWKQDGDTEQWFGELSPVE